MFSSKRLTQRSLCDTPRTGHRLRAGRLAPEERRALPAHRDREDASRAQALGCLRAPRREAKLHALQGLRRRLQDSALEAQEAVRAHPELKVLAESDEAGIFALSTEGGRQIFFTGHAEYDAGILNAEYRRDRAAGLFVRMRQKSAGSPEGAGTLALRCCARRDSGAQRSFRP